MDKVLVIDDEETKKTRLGKKIIKLLEPEGFEVIFAQTWDEPKWKGKAQEIIKNDIQKEIRLVLLDVEFPTQKLEGEQIFEKIRELRPDIEIVILTKRDSYTEAEDFQERGAAHYIVKRTFERRSQKLLNYIKGLMRDPSNAEYVLHLTPISDSICYMDIQDKVGRSMLKQRRKLTTPIAQVVLGCASNPDKSVDFPETDETTKEVKGLEPYNREDIHKEVWKFNDGIRKSSEGRVQPILKGMGVHGATAYKLVIGEVKIHKSSAH